VLTFEGSSVVIASSIGNFKFTLRITLHKVETGRVARLLYIGRGNIMVLTAGGYKGTGSGDRDQLAAPT